mgnify:FL=1
MAEKELPSRIPVFPLTGAIVFPRGRLPLHVFEPRYRTMIRDAMAGDKVIGMIQPREHAENKRSRKPPLFEIGGLGRISQCSETHDGRYLISLEGVTRFRIARELDVATPYRQVEADYDVFAADQETAAPLMPAMRAAVEAELKSYLDRSGQAADWNAVSDSDDETLVNTLANACPFATAEKQALLEAGDLLARAELLIQIMQFTVDGTDVETGETLQ